MLRRRALFSALIAAMAIGMFSRPLSGGAQGPGLQYLPDIDASAPVMAADALQCSLLDTTTGNGAGVLGQDGGYSYAAGSSVDWHWSDTMLSSTASPYIPDAFATSPLQPPATGADPAATACFPMQYKTSPDGTPAPILPQPAPDCVDWPTQFVSPSDGATTLYYLYVRRAPSANTAPCSLGEGAGIGEFDTTTQEGQRLDDAPTWQASASATFQVTGGTPLRADDGDGEYIYMFLVGGGSQNGLASSTDVALARVPPSEFPDPAQYRYWTGSSWVSWDVFSQIPPEDNGHLLWRQPDFGIAAGLNVVYLAHLHKWVATYATSFAGQVRVRTADHLTGPWSNETRLIDCVQQLNELPPAVGPSGDLACYSAMIHNEFTSADGLTIYASFARNDWHGGMGDYRVYMRRFNLASPIVDWLAPDGTHTLKVDGVADSGQRQGIAFFESEAPLPGYAPVYAFESQATPGDREYAPGPVAPSGYRSIGVAFYAPGNSGGIDTSVVPVHAVLLPTGQHAYTIGAVPAGATDQGIVFNALAPVVDSDGDGIPNTTDNCVFRANRDQSDIDGDRAGDACDVDADNDDIADVQVVDAPFPLAPLDNCPTVANTDQADTDGDGLGDACEPPVYHTDPMNADTDSDGCGDGTEVRLGLDPTNPWDFFSVPVPALISGSDPMKSTTYLSISPGDMNAVWAYFLAGAKVGSAAYDQDLDHNAVKDGIEYDRSILPGGKVGPPDGVVSPQDVQIAVAEFNDGLRC